MCDMICISNYWVAISKKERGKIKDLVSDALLIWLTVLFLKIATGWW